MVEEGPWVDADAVEPFSLEEMVAKYRHHGLAAALGNPAIAYAEGRCVGGSTEINSGLYHRLPDHLAAEWRTAYAIDEFSPEALGGYADRVERDLSVAPLPGARPRRRPPWSGAPSWAGTTSSSPGCSATARAGARSRRCPHHDPPSAGGGRRLIPDCRVLRLLRQGDRIVGARCRRTHPGGVERMTSRPTTSSCAVAPFTARRCCSAAGSGATWATG